MKQFNNLKNSGENQNIIKRYILHFEVNNTIILPDTLKQLTKDENLHQILAAYAWGKLDHSQETPQWKLMHNFFCVNKPNSEYISYQEYIYSTMEVNLDENMSNEQIKEEEEKVERKKKDMFLNFIRQGQVGAKLKADYEKIVKQLNLPRQVVEEMKISKDLQQTIQVQNTMMQTKNQTLDEENQDKHELVQLFQDGKYFILPYFFKFLVNLKKNKKEFGIVLRSAGLDLEDVVKEMNYFAHGQHPCFSGKTGLPLVRFDGSKGSRSLIVQQMNKLVIYRDSKDSSLISGVFGSLTRQQGEYQKLDEIYEKEVYEESVEMAKDSTRLFVKLQEALKENSCMAIQDQQASEQDYQKPLYIDQADYNTLHILFDSNLGIEDNCSVDLRDVVTHQKIPYKKAINKYMVKVEPLSMIRDADYLMKCLKECEVNRLEEIERIERGEEEEDQIEVIKEQDQWESLMNANHSSYLRQTIMPLLYPAMQLVDRERPDDPILQIAMYMLKNKDKVNMPEPPKKVETKEAPPQDKEEPQEEQS